jgi:hypothetical protein
VANLTPHGRSIWKDRYVHLDISSSDEELKSLFLKTIKEKDLFSEKTQDIYHYIHNNLSPLNYITTLHSIFTQIVDRHSFSLTDPLQPILQTLSDSTQKHIQTKALEAKAPIQTKALEAKVPKQNDVGEEATVGGSTGGIQSKLLAIQSLASQMSTKTTRVTNEPNG